LRSLPHLLVLALAAMSLAGCGFHLRGQEPMPFKSIYVDTGNPKTSFIGYLRRDFERSQVAQAAAANAAEVVLQIVSESSELQILTLDSSGRVTEYRLIYRVSLRAYDHNKQNWIPAIVMEMHRDYFYDDSQVLAKTSEQNLLAESMYSEMAQQIVRRLSLAKPQPQ
jgi:LPS-assembly lipoprotein